MPHAEGDDGLGAQHGGFCSFQSLWGRNMEGPPGLSDSTLGLVECPSSPGGAQPIDGLADILVLGQQASSPSLFLLLHLSLLLPPAQSVYLDEKQAMYSWDSCLEMDPVDGSMAICDSEPLYALIA